MARDVRLAIIPRLQHLCAEPANPVLHGMATWSFSSPKVADGFIQFRFVEVPDMLT